MISFSHCLRRRVPVPVYPYPGTRTLMMLLCSLRCCCSGKKVFLATPIITSQYFPHPLFKSSRVFDKPRLAGCFQGNVWCQLLQRQRLPCHGVEVSIRAQMTLDPAALVANASRSQHGVVHQIKRQFATQKFGRCFPPCCDASNVQK